jgi:hypothetical protein
MPTARARLRFGRRSARLAIVSIIAGLAPGCAFDPHKQVEVITDPPGARIELNGDFVGLAPTIITMLGEPDGEVEQDYVVRAYPPGPEFYPQAKVFSKRVGDDDRIPKRIFFDMRVRQPADTQPATTAKKPWP